VRRRVVATKYADLVEALYSGDDHVAIEAQVIFADGRSGTVKATLHLRDVTPVTAEVLARVS
jgi:long-chain acyl-CoA synthetase